MELIDKEKLLKELLESDSHHVSNSREGVLLDRNRYIVRCQPTVEAIPKADYENRLKAILVELQLEIEELRLDKPLFSRGYECYGFEDKTTQEIKDECSEIIQHKINSLK